jgi:hypothetical protein
VLSATGLPVLVNSNPITVQHVASSTGGGTPVVTGNVATIPSAGKLQVPITALGQLTAGATYTFSLTVAPSTDYASVTRYFAVRVKYGAWQEKGQEGRE